MADQKEIVDKLSPRDSNDGNHKRTINGHNKTRARLDLPDVVPGNNDGSKLWPPAKTKGLTDCGQANEAIHGLEINNINAITDEDEDDDDDLVMPNIVPAQILCPLSKCRIELPVRGRKCRHIQCFDASTYLLINERKPSWKCPVCDGPASYEDLIVDG
ncbi:unnamed protein product [Protopolystoma xenopodis]|uniref:SP-RING-type domain-containing protein n=1 Tax=Protopolystoma xenopodis TaxID=117903 RepID=A0A448X3Z0_9PLAT|nr:unnamed protein product [Protopolystoma xenopodis]